MEKFITQNKYMEKGYLQYFSPEIRPFINDYWINSIKEYRFKQYIIKQVNEELPNNFNDLRKIGENNSLICKIIRNDSIQEFIKYVNENHFSLEATIEQSIYETNPFLIKNLKTTLIEYADFFGSKSDNSFLVKEFLKNKNIDINKTIFKKNI